MTMKKRTFTKEEKLKIIKEASERGINEKGYINNCLSMDKHYGNIMDNNLKEVVQSQEFQKFWYIKKDDIEVCNECEYRYVCQDCRAFTKNGDNKSKPLFCNYKP